MVHQTVVSSTLLVITAVVMMLISANAVPTDNVQMGGCSESSDCQPKECCVLGRDRHSTRGCRPLLNEGNNCRPRDPPPGETWSLDYPSGVPLAIQGVYSVLCPCDPDFGLDCYRGTCVKSTYYETTNAV